MAEFTNAAVQTVAANANVQFTDRIGCNSCIDHRAGSGIVTLRGNTNQCRARYRVHFGGNIAVAAGGTAGAISIALALDGEPLAASLGTVVPAAVGDLWNISVDAYIDIPRGCCRSVTVRNVNAQAIDVANANLIVERIA